MSQFIATMNELEYMDAVLGEFSCEVVANFSEVSEYHLEGVDYHFDKARQYRDRWEENGLVYNRALIVYLMTYTPLLSSRLKHESCEWVIANYESFMPFLLAVEKRVFPTLTIA